MIRLIDILQEITFGGIEPYQTQFVWSVLTSLRYETRFQADGQPVRFQMDTYGDTGEYEFVIVMENRSGIPFGTVTHFNSAARGQINYLRLLRTAGEAILDFCAQHAPKSIDVSAVDRDPARAEQKNEIYKNVLLHNRDRFTQAGYGLSIRANQIQIVRNA